MMNTQPKWTLEGRVKLVGNPDSESGQHTLYVADIRLEDRCGSVCYIQSADHCEDGITREEAEKHAKLLVAAPELLEALRAVISELKHVGADGWMNGEVHSDDWLRAVDVIARATGEQA